MSCSHNPALEGVLHQMLEYLSIPINRTEERIINLFIPRMLNYSARYSSGLKLDLGHFDGTLSEDQKNFFLRVFRQPIMAKLNTTVLKPDELFFYLREFPTLRHLCIHVTDSDTFKFPDEKTNFSVISISSIEYEYGTWLDPVHQIISNNELVIHDLSLTDTKISQCTLEYIGKNPLDSLELINIAFLIEDDANWLNYLITNKETLKDLSLISTIINSDRTKYFDHLIDMFFEKLKTKQMFLDEFRFTIDQEKDRKDFSLLNTGPHLKKLTVYYTTERKFLNIANLIREININHRDGSMRIPDINFVEYFTNWSGVYRQSAEAKTMMKVKSQDYKVKIMEMATKYVSITTFDYDEVYDMDIVNREN